MQFGCYTLKFGCYTLVLKNLTLYKKEERPITAPQTPHYDWYLEGND